MSNLAILRTEFQNGSTEVRHMLDHPVYESWQRCVSNNLQMDGPVDYGFLSNDQLSSALAMNQQLIESSKKPLDFLYKALGGAGWSVLFTDQQCNALQVYPSKVVSEQRIRDAFRKGAILSEELIGTSAMSCAIASKRFVRVYGQEHFKACHTNFNCVAVPLFDPAGRVCGSVDITNQSPRIDEGAYYLLEACARNIQADLIRSLPDTIVVQLKLENSPLSMDNLILAFSYDHTLVGANQMAQRFLGVNLCTQTVRFEQIFQNDFPILFDQGMLKGRPFNMTLSSGIELEAQIQNFPDSSKSSSVFITQNISQPVTATPSDLFFGDQNIELLINKSLKAITRLPVLVLGESGAGKEVVAKTIHESSAAKKGELVSLNCASIPESLIESELFGYESGAFTGASRSGLTGKIQQANGGTLFLDEIGDMPLSLQTRLLRVLETREVIKLGSNKVDKVDFQLICATNKDLRQCVETGQFRQDLFYRINGFEIKLPALRERSDLPGLAKHLLRNVSQNQREFSISAEKLICAYRWPGNVRELRNAILYADALAEPGIPIECEHLPETVHAGVDQRFSEEPCEGQVLRTAYEEAIIEALNKCNGNMTQAAKYLGIGRATLYRKLKKLNL